MDSPTPSQDNVSNSAAPQAPMTPVNSPPPKKRTGLKIVKWTAVVLLLIVIGAVVGVYVYLDAIVKKTIVTQTAVATNLSTELGAAKLSLSGGGLSLKDLKLGSPEGFSAPQMLTLGDADVKVTLGELRSDPVRIASVTLNKPTLVIERGAGGSLNFKTAADRMPPSDPNSTVNLVITDLTIKDASVIIRPGIPGLAEQFVVPIPSVNMKDIGSGEGAKNGAAMKDVVMQVITVMVAEASRSGGLPDELKALMNLNLAQAVGQLGAEAQKRIAAAIPGEIGQALGALVKDPNALLKDPGGALKQGLGDAVGGLLGGKGSTTQPTTGPAEAPKSIQDGLKGLLDRKKKEDK